ncbi:protein SET DOMAIN GROUP 40 isoform X1 [Trifolium pratense]|uniref:protein SET DOMAIN GROUP 40 isoform X1 n=1 Tax=Trifolium pratense TaxID=57577 RepID=UPI001E697938|nr:protein SET DOMAIN GROUP 40 isoform X1 [Trifolium pratense]
MEHEQRSFESFLTWTSSHLGISDSSTTTNQSHHSLGHSLCVSIFPHSGGRGLGAVRDLKKGELILRVPKSALLTSECVMEDKKLCLAVNRHSSLSSVQILTVCLLYEVGKGKTSRWHPYLVHLPQSYDLLAMFGEFEKQALQVQFLLEILVYLIRLDYSILANDVYQSFICATTYVINNSSWCYGYQVDEAMWVTEKAVQKAKSEWKEALALMEDLMFKPQLLTFKAWVWAAATISSRTLHIPWDEAGCLCPIGDLFNYDAPGEELSGIENVTALSNGDKSIDVDEEQIDFHSQRLTDGGFEEDSNAYCFYARTNYKKGDQVLLCYGTYTNLELLEHYGFLLQENPNDKIFIPLEPAMYTSTSWSKESLYIHHDGKPSFALLAALRLWATPHNKRRSVGHLAYSGSQLSADNEIIIMKWLSKTCDAVLKNMPTSIEDDTLLVNALDSTISQDLITFMKIAKLMSSRDEVYTFLEAHNITDALSLSEMILSKKARSSMERWKLAVLWRLRYKKVLVDCISYCNRVLDSFMR